MTIQYASDLHLEFPENEFYIKNNPLKPGADVLILAGDILQFKSMITHDWFFDYVSKNFGVTYWIAGNHEYYNSDLANKSGTFNETIKSNVFLVNDFAVTIEHVRLIFATLWTSISPRNQIAIERRMNDFHLIRHYGNRLSATDLKEHHDRSVTFIEHELMTTSQEIKKIVVTHHVPTFRNYPEEYKFDVLRGRIKKID